MSDRPSDDAVPEQLSGRPIRVPITDVLDLHPFRPKEVASVIREYLDAACDAGLRRLRIIHGRGKGVQRNTVRTLLERDPRVTAFGDAPLEAGGWGATWVEMGIEEEPGSEQGWPCG